MQISEQIQAFGSAINVRVAVIIGGMSLIEQGLQLSRKPHIVIATPGRLRHHLQTAQPPDISRAQFIVLDEADRLLSGGFADELEIILSRMSSRRKTLLFSATLTDSIEQLQCMTLSDALKFDLTLKQKIPSRLIQNYLLVPSKIKTCYLIACLKKQYSSHADAATASSLDDKNLKNKKKDRSLQDLSAAERLTAPLIQSIIIFVGSCYKCQELFEILNEMNFDCVALHSLMNQTLRFSSLQRFKSHLSRILIATDVASRGLDIPDVDLVINFDLPKICADYIHRIGRTARIGKAGRALSFVTQYDIELVTDIESSTGQKMTASTEINEAELIPMLNPISKALRIAKMKLLDSGFEDSLATSKKRKRKQKRQMIKKVDK
jgi:ATP-dependent RNA helicase DDX49/DBP8